MDIMLSNALRESTGLFKQLLTNLLGKDALVWGNELKAFLRKEPCWHAATSRNFLTWKTVWIDDDHSVELVIVSVRELGFGHMSSKEPLLKGVEQLKLRPIPTEARALLKLEENPTTPNEVLVLIFEPSEKSEQDYHPVRAGRWGTRLGIWTEESELLWLCSSDPMILSSEDRVVLAR